jgi:hypothetical protein
MAEEGEEEQLLLEQMLPLLPVVTEVLEQHHPSLAHL